MSTTKFLTQIVDNQTKQVIKISNLVGTLSSLESVLSEVDSKLLEVDEALSNIGNQAVESLRAVSEVNQQVTTTPTPFCYEVLKKIDNFTLNNDCEISSNTGGTFQLALSAHFDLTSGGTNKLNTWVEYFDLTLEEWVPVSDSGNVREMDKNAEGLVNYNNVFDLPVDIKMRFMHSMSSGTAVFYTETIPTVEVVSPSVSLSIHKL